MFFIWDETKNKSNTRKHGISFEEAEAVFTDEQARLLADPAHSDDEDRFILMGMSLKLSLLVVVHVYKENDDVIRIISARKATKKETTFYMR